MWGYEDDGLTEGDNKEISIFINYIRLTNHQSAPFHLNVTVPYWRQSLESQSAQLHACLARDFL